MPGRLGDPAAWPDAILATNGPTGLGVLRGFHNAGLKTPRDFGFVTFGELAVDDIFEPAVTTVVQPAYDIDFRAAEILPWTGSQRATPRDCPIA